MAKNELSEEDKQKVIAALRRKGVGLRNCPMCERTNSWIVADGYINHPIQTQIGGLVIGGPSIPTAALICSNCGFVSQHALGALELLPRDTEAKK